MAEAVANSPGDDEDRAFAQQVLNALHRGLPIDHVAACVTFELYQRLLAGRAIGRPLNPGEPRFGLRWRRDESGELICEDVPLDADLGEPTAGSA